MNFKLMILYQNVWIANFNNNNIDWIISRGRTATTEILLTCQGVKKKQLTLLRHNFHRLVSTG